MNIIRRILGSLEARLSQPWFNPVRTIYFNFRTLPFSIAIKLPIFIYGRVRFFILNGKVVFKDTPIKTGMVKIGINADSFALFDHSGFIHLGSKHSVLVFKGPASISVNSKIRVCANGEICLGKYAYIGAGVRIVCNGQNIDIGEYTRIAFETVIMNSGFHHVYNVNKQSITRTTRSIIIGKYSWIGNRSSIAAGAALKDFSIVCSGSLINRDYTISDGENPMLGGVPAKIIGYGFKRIFSPKHEKEIVKWFASHPHNDVFHVEYFEDNIIDINEEF